ncbi:hypothetical protein RFI_06350 [Reticulomyxa filosa]|uniref:Uncharacterized protein n=1 Tax=Reticulomyxa filosa TaxID=46433 RepID=X6NXQ6_RETFI|nr:hypothetical protein RFI_06350 [Reticulomyxa filosa]|eukprot:ETO30771.1 hypothetical protein RFI_06350 [Reticulomyxa filosa]
MAEKSNPNDNIPMTKYGAARGQGNAPRSKFHPYGANASQPTFHSHGANAFQPTFHSHGASAFQPTFHSHGASAFQPTFHSHGANAFQPTFHSHGANASQNWKKIKNTKLSNVWASYREKQVTDLNPVEEFHFYKFQAAIAEEIFANKLDTAEASLEPSELKPKLLGNMDWSWTPIYCLKKGSKKKKKKKKRIDEKDTDPADIEKLEKHIQAPSVYVPYLQFPTLPFQMYGPANIKKSKFAYPIVMPVYALALAAVKRYKLRLEDYDIVSLRPGIKRICSASEQLNTNFQLINGILFAEDVNVAPTALTSNFGYQFELYCTNQNRPEVFFLINGEGKGSGLPALTQQILYTIQHKEGNEEKEKEKKKRNNNERQKKKKKVPLPIYAKNQEFFQLLDIRIGKLRMLIASEVDAVDIDTEKPVELKFGSRDMPVSIWTQTLFSGIEQVFRGSILLFCYYCCSVGIQALKADEFFKNKIQRKSTLIMFYRILEKIKFHCKATVNETCNDPGFQVSQMFRLTRKGDTEKAFLCKVFKPEYLITKQQWENNITRVVQHCINVLWVSFPFFNFFRKFNLEHTNDFNKKTTFVISSINFFNILLTLFSYYSNFFWKCETHLY